MTKEGLTDIVKSTRQQPVLNRVDLPGGDCILPENFRPGLFPHWGILKIGATGEVFLLTERSFCRINGFFLGLPSRLIKFYLSQAQGKQVTVLDAGGGRDARTAREMAADYPGVQVLNVDQVAVGETYRNFISQPGDICNLGLPDGSIDLAYSHQVLPFMQDLRRIKSIEEIARVLKPGGTGVIDYTDTPSMPKAVLAMVGQQVDGVVLPRDKSYGGVFLLIARNPIKPVESYLGGRSEATPRV